MAKKSSRVNIVVDTETDCWEVAESAIIDCTTVGCRNPRHRPPADPDADAPRRRSGRRPMTVEERLQRYVENYGAADGHWIMSRRSLPTGENIRTLVYAMHGGGGVDPYTRLRATCGDILCCRPDHMEVYRTPHRTMVERKEAQQRAMEKRLYRHGKRVTGGKF